MPAFPTLKNPYDIALVTLGIAGDAIDQIGDTCLRAHVRALQTRLSELGPDPRLVAHNTPALERHRIQAAGYCEVVAHFDRWFADPADDRPLTDIIRDTYDHGVRTGVNSLVPEIHRDELNRLDLLQACLNSVTT